MKPRRRLVLGVLVCSLVLGPMAVPAKESFIVDALKAAGTGSASFLAQQAFIQIAGAIYTNTCAVDAPEEATLQFLCDALGSASGASEAEWRDSVSADLAAIRQDLESLKMGQEAIQRQVADVAAQNRVLLAKVDALAAETLIQNEVALIRTLWEDEFLRIFDRSKLKADSREAFRADLLHFAERVKTEKLATALGKIHDTLVRRSAGKDHLLRLFTINLERQMEASRVDDVLPPYEYYQGVMADLLLIQRQGSLMYQMAAEIFESECELDRACVSLQGLPHTSSQFSELFSQHVDEQLDAFQSSLEALVLARSSPRSIRADFLPPNSAAAFQKADFFTAANQGRVSGIYGRVISMGDAFDGQLEMASPGGQLQLGFQKRAAIPSSHGKLDWWRFTGVDALGELHREVSFATEWKIYRYHVDLETPGVYKISTTMPHAPAVELRRSTEVVVGRTEEGLTWSAVPFASFTAIQRGGGGFGLLSGNWGTGNYRLNDSIQTTAALKDRVWRSVAYRNSNTGEIYVGVDSRAQLRYSTHVETMPWSKATDSNDAFLRGISPFGYREGGALTLNVELSCFYPCKPDDFARKDSVLEVQSDFRKGGTDPKPSALSAEVRFVLLSSKPVEPGSNGVVESINHKNIFKPVDEGVRKSKLSATVVLDKNDRYTLYFGAKITAQQQTVGWDASSWKLLAQLAVTNAYLTSD